MQQCIRLLKVDFWNIIFNFFFFIFKVEKLLAEISDCINKQDTNLLLRLFKSKVSPFKAIIDENIDWYMAQLTQEKESKLVSLKDILKLKGLEIKLTKIE